MQKNENKSYDLQIADNQNAEYVIIHEDGTFSIPLERASDDRSLHPILAHHFRLVHNSQSFPTNAQIIDSKEVKYVSQVQCIKDEMNDDNAYNIAPQQYYVDTSNSFISVTDNELVLSTEVSNNAYSHSYLLQPFTENADINTSEDILSSEVQIQNTDCGDKKSLEESKNSQFYTEVTLDEEQCQNLEKNGWILLEFNEKVYLLNKNGLHDITDNHALIEQYKSSSECHSNEILTENSPSSTEEYARTKTATTEIKSIYLMQENSFLELKTDETNKYSNVSGLIENQELSLNYNTDGVTQNNISVTENIEGDALTKGKIKFLNSNAHKCPRFKTNLTLNDLHQKLKLGKTSNGKRLVATIMSIDNNSCSAQKYEENNKKDAIMSNEDSTIYINSGVPKDFSHLEAILELMEQKFMHDTDNTGWCSAEDVSATEEIITNLLNVPSSRDMILGQNIVLTKMTLNISKTLVEGGVETRLRPVVISGRIGQFTSNGDWHFVYLPHMIPNLLKNKDIDVDEFEMSTNGLPLPRDDVPTDGCFLHIHVSKERTSTRAVVTIVKRYLPLKLRNESNSTVHVCNVCTAVFKTTEQFDLHSKSCFIKHDNLGKLDNNNSNTETSTYNDTMDSEDCVTRNKRRMRLHACSACAAIFETEEELKLHQKSACEVNKNCQNDTTKDTSEEQSDKCGTVSTAKGYICTQCKKQFNRITNYRKHLPTHYKSGQKLKNNGSPISAGYTMEELKIHKCNICSCSYYHAATLTKHIKSMHLNIDSDKIKE